MTCNVNIYSNFTHLDITTTKQGKFGASHAVSSSHAVSTIVNRNSAMNKRKINSNIITNNMNQKIHQKSSQGSVKSTSNRPIHHSLLNPPPAWITEQQQQRVSMDYDESDESDDNNHNKNRKISSNRNRNRDRKHHKHPIEFGVGFTSDEEDGNQGDIDFIDLVDSDSDHNQSKLRNQSRASRRSQSAGPPSSPPRNPNRKSNRIQSKVKKSEDLVGSESVEFINKLSEGAIVTNMSLLCGRFPKQQKKLQHIVRHFYRQRMSKYLHLL